MIRSAAAATLALALAACTGSSGAARDAGDDAGDEDLPPDAGDSIPTCDPSGGTDRAAEPGVVVTRDWSGCYALDDGDSFAARAGAIAAIEGSGAIDVVSLAALSLNRAHTDLAEHPGGLTYQDAFRWDAADAGDGNWFPQGMSMSASGAWMAVTWPWVTYPDGVQTNEALRVSFTKHPGAGAGYRHVLLVEPVIDASVPGGANFQVIARHGDGLVWAQPYLYVADACRGWMVFDTRHIWHIPDHDDGAIGWDAARESFHARWHLYAMPRVGQYSFGADSVCGGEPTQHPPLGGATLDRETAPARPVLFGYEITPGSANRIIGWPIDPDTGLLVERSDARVHPVAGYTAPLGAPSMLHGFARTRGALYLDVNGAPDAATDPDGSAGCTTYSALLRADAVPAGTSPLARVADLSACTEAFHVGDGGGAIWAINESIGHKEIVVFAPP